MNIFKVYAFIMSVFIILFFNACSNNSDTPASTTATPVIPVVTTPTTTTPSVVDTNTTTTSISTVILPVTSTTVNTHNEIVSIKVSIIDEKNNPFTTGNVKIIYPNDVRVGRDIGSFKESTVAVDNGVANFTYTSPSNLDANTSNILFSFYHDSNPTQTALYTISILPLVNQIVLTNYTLNTSITTDVNMGLEDRKAVSFTLLDDQDALVKDTDITSIKITSLNPSIGILEDKNGTTAASITLSNKNSVTVNVKSNTKSGLVPLKVEATFTDVNNQEQNLSKVFNVVILSGPPTAMSLSYVGSNQVDARAKYVDRWALTVTDKYNNPVNTAPAVSMGAMVGYAQDSSNTAANSANNLYFKNSADINATLDHLKATANVFGSVDQVHDYLVTFGSGYTYDASGKWDINTNNDTSILDFVDGFDGNDTLNMGFAVGHNQRNDACRTGIEWIANVYPDNNNYIIDDTGSLIINIEYDYYLAGKDIILWVNLNGLQNSDTTIGRIGEARKLKLRGIGVTAQKVDFSKGFDEEVTLKIQLDGTGEYLRNTRFEYDVEVLSDDANWIVSDDSVSRGVTYCNGENGTSYVKVNFTTPTANSGSVTLKNIVLLNEF